MSLPRSSPLVVPEILPRPGGYEFVWPAEVRRLESSETPLTPTISIRVERLREHHDSITAEFWATRGENKEHLLGGLRFNLVTPSGRGSMARALGERMNGVDWGGMLEQVCIYALRKFREQEQPEVIGFFPEDRELKFRLAPVLPEGVSTLLFGYGDMLKTTLALAWGLLVHTGEGRLGLKPKQSPIMLLDWETNKEIANKLLVSLWAGFGSLPPLGEIIYRRCRRPLLEFIEEVKADVEREGIGLIILDSMGKACGSERVLKEEVLPTLIALESLNITNLIISHRPKGEEGKARGTYGSAYMDFDVRQSFRVEGPPQLSSSFREVILNHSKHNLMALIPPFGYKLTWGSTGDISIVTQEVAEMVDIADLLAAVYKIEQALKDSPKLTALELKEATGEREGTIRQTLKRYEGKRFVNLGGKPALWGLLSPKQGEEG